MASSARRRALMPALRADGRRRRSAWSRTKAATISKTVELRFGKCSLVQRANTIRPYGPLARHVQVIQRLSQTNRLDIGGAPEILGPYCVRLHSSTAQGVPRPRRQQTSSYTRRYLQPCILHVDPNCRSSGGGQGATDKGAELRTRQIGRKLMYRLVQLRSVDRIILERTVCAPTLVPYAGLSHRR
jgi:hypothetical protein